MPLSALVGKIIFVIGLVTFVAIRVPFDKQRKSVRVDEARRGVLEGLLMAGVGVGCFLVPLLYVFTPLFAFADTQLDVGRVVTGTLLLVLGLWLFRRTHVDLGSNWSPTLELRESHQLVNRGVYRFVRHPMYSSFLVYGLAQVSLLANWVAGPAFLVAFGLMFVFRLGPEERMMRDRFGKAYDEYAAVTKRLIPYVW